MGVPVPPPTPLLLSTPFPFSFLSFSRHSSFSLVAFFPSKKRRLNSGFSPVQPRLGLAHNSHRSSTAHTCLPACPCCSNYLGAGVVRLGSFVVWVHRHSFVARPANFCLYFSCFFFPRFSFTCQQLHSFAA